MDKVAIAKNLYWYIIIGMKKELTQIYIEKYQKDWLRKEAEKKKLSIAAIVRNIIDYFLKNEKEE